MVTLKQIYSLILVGLLAGCASTPEPVSKVERPQRAVAPASVQTKQVTPTPAVKLKPVDKPAQQCLAQVLYWEARGEGTQGMVAVASVVFNRVDDSRFPDSVCGVVHEGGETAPCQFSWWCDGKSDYPSHESSWTEVNRQATAMLTARPNDPTEGALFFHSNSIKSPWRRKPTTQIGNHIFYP